ncbi:MAG: hypothetical protein K6D02_02075 [Lachnospiraceae bacterium]|nr:hypothetical protein [Lachnospiraceae bacterium]
MRRQVKSIFKNRIGNRITAVILAGALIVGSPLGYKAAKATETSNVKYIKEVVLSYGKTEKEARVWLEKKGYEVLDGDLNSGTSDDGEIKTNVVLMGYKTTSNKGEAIRDMSVMNMSGGYSITDMQEVIKAKNKDALDRFNHFSELVKAYKTNYKLGVKSKAKGGVKNACAIRVHDILNKYIDEDSNDKMGNFFLSDFEKEENSEKLYNCYIQMNSKLRGIIESILTMASGEGNVTWLQRMGNNNSTMSYFARIKKKKKTNKLAKEYIDKNYGDEINELLDDFDDISERIEKTNEITKDIEEKYGVEDVTEKEIKEYFGITESKKMEIDDSESLEKNMDKEDLVLDSMEGSKEASDYSEMLSMISYLNSIEYGKETLCDYFMKEKGYYEKEDNRYELGAVVEAMSDVERESYGKTTNLYTAIKNGMQDDDSLWKGNKDIKKQVTYIDNTIEKMDEISIYEGMEREMCDGVVAVTSSAQSRTTDIFNEDVSVGASAAIISVSIITSIIGSLFIYTGVKYLVNLASSIGTVIVNVKNFTSFNAFTGKVMLGVRNAISFIVNFKSYSKYVNDLVDPIILLNFDKQKAYDAAYKRITRFNNICGGIVLAVGVIVATIGIIFSIREICKIVSEKKESYEGDYSKEIPEFMVDVSKDDNGFKEYTYYRVVKCNRNDSEFTGVKRTEEGLKDYGDINGDTGKQWVALYTTIDPNFGEPILADSLKVQNGNISILKKNTVIHSFNEPNVSFNLTSQIYNYSDEKGGTYVTYETEASSTKNINTNTASAFSDKPNTIIIISGFLTLFLTGAVYYLYRRKREEM